MLDKLGNLAKLGDIPNSVLEGIKAVMADGKVEMSDITAVAGAAEKLGFGEAAGWIEANAEKYLKAFSGKEGGLDLGSLNPFK